MNLNDLMSNFKDLGLQIKISIKSNIDKIKEVVIFERFKEVYQIKPNLFDGIETVEFLHIIAIKFALTDSKQ